MKPITDFNLMHDASKLSILEWRILCSGVSPEELSMFVYLIWKKALL